MAKDKEKTKADPKEEKAKEREFKFGVEDLAEALDLKPASVRVQLRNKGIEKAGKSYGWDTKAELKEVIEQIKSKKEEEPKKGKKAPEPEPKKGKDKGKKKPKDEEDDD